MVIVRDWIGMAQPSKPSFRIEPCPDCRGDKGFAYPIDIDRRDGSLIEGWQDCLTCGAEGEIEVELEPVDLDDLVDVLVPAEARDDIFTTAVLAGQCMYWIDGDGVILVLDAYGHMEPLK